MQDDDYKYFHVDGTPKIRKVISGEQEIIFIGDTVKYPEDTDFRPIKRLSRRQRQELEAEAVLELIEEEDRETRAKINMFLATLREKPKTASEEALKLIRQNNIELWHSDGVAYMTIYINGHYENHAVRSEKGRRYPQQLFYEEFEKPLNKNSLEEVLNTLETEALFNGDEHKVFMRIGTDGEYIYHDLCNDNWEVIRIGQRGFWLDPKPPIKFIRNNNMLSLPYPEWEQTVGLEEDSKLIQRVLDELWLLLNLVDNDGVTEEEFEQKKKDRIFAFSWLLASFKPDGPYPLLMLNGEKGSIKTSFSKALLNITDPCKAPLVKLPKVDQDLFVLAKNRWCLGFDNNSGIPADLADALCSISTGGGYGSRQLYTNTEVNTYEVCRPMIINGIGNLTNRPDLIDRVLPINTKPVTEYVREAELKKDFCEMLPLLLTYIYENVSNGLYWQDKINIDEKLPRMADFSHWILSCLNNGLMFFRQSEFIELMKTSINQTWADIAEGDIFISTLKSWVYPANEGDKDFETFIKTNKTHDKIYPYDLWYKIISRAGYTPEDTKLIPDSLPKTSRLLDTYIQRSAPVLRAQGVDIQTFASGRKYYTIKKILGQQPLGDG